jgi:uncharacterized protein (TIGR03545 family)
MKAGLRIFRWRAVGPLLLFLALLIGGWILFADRIARSQAESGLSQLLGTEVDIGSVRIRSAEAAVDVGNLAIADPRDPDRNLLEAGDITVDIDPLPLAEKKLIVDQVRLSGLRFLTARKTPARPADPDSPAGRLLKETAEWARDKFQFPKLALGRVDSLKQLVLQPDQLGSVKASKALSTTVDSVRTGFERAVSDLRLQPLVDSSTALANRLAATDPRSLGLTGIRDAAAQVQQTIGRLKEARSGLAALQQSAEASVGVLQKGLADVDAARQRDYATAKGLLNLPSLDAPNIGASLFGPQSTDYFQRALYFAQVVQRYVPPGLQPWNRPGPERTRLAGTTVEFPKMHEYPRFLLREGMIDLATGSAAQNLFTARFGGLTSQPELLGRPATVTGSGRLGAASPITVQLSALSRHYGSAPVDSLAASVQGVSLPAISLPGLPFTVTPGRSTVGLRFSLAGDRLAGAWDINTTAASWASDTSRVAQPSLVESTVWSVVQGLSDLSVHAELGGTIDAPTLSVRSNLDDAIATRLRSLAGEALASAERRARQAVDALVDTQIAAVRTQVSGLSSRIADRLPVERNRLDGAQRSLEAQLKRLTASGLGGISLPKL